MSVMFHWESLTGKQPMHVHFGVFFTFIVIWHFYPWDKSEDKPFIALFFNNSTIIEPVYEALNNIDGSV